MPSSSTGRSTLDIVGLVARRGEADLRSLAAVARGEALGKETAEALIRAGLLRAGSPPRLPARLLVPVLALEASLGLQGERLLVELHGLLRRADGAPARDSLLHALGAELDAHLDELKHGRSMIATETALEVIADLAETVRCLSDSEADPALVTRVAELAARLVQRLAHALQPRRVRPRASRPCDDEQALYLAIAGMGVSLPRPRFAPDAATLASALAGPQALTLEAGRVREMPVARHGANVQAALADPEPLQALYAGYNVEEALRRHARAIATGRDGFAAAGRLPGADRADGPPPLAWTTTLDACALTSEVPSEVPSVELAAVA